MSATAPQNLPRLILVNSFVVLALVLASAGCSSPQMKGTPFYTGEYAKRNGPAEQRVNFWPALYYRDPALSVLWPVFESTDDHTAIRPLYSVYGLDETNREYNFLWPIAQFDYRTGRDRVFPVFWSSNSFTLFPLYWHSRDPYGAQGGTDALWPLYTLNRSTNHFNLWSPWPLVENWSNKQGQESGSMVLPLYWHETNSTGSSFYSLPWWSRTETNGNYWRLLAPLYYQASNETFSAMATPLYAQGRSGSNDWHSVIPLMYWNTDQHTLLSPLWATWQTRQRKTALAPWAASWWTSTPKKSDLYMLAGLAHATWGSNSGPHHVFPIYYRNERDHVLLTPLFGWNEEHSGFFYPVTPLVGAYTGRDAGSWAFPLYSYSRDQTNGDLSERFFVLGGYNKTAAKSHSWFIPLYSFRNNGPLDSFPTNVTPSKFAYNTYGTKFWCLPYCWYENQSHLSWTMNVLTNDAQAGLTQTNTQPVRQYSFKSGAFPFYTYSRESTPAQNNSEVKASAGVIFYDYKHELSPEPGKQSTNDYTRARVLWRLYHYERRNGDVSVDVFPSVTYDSKTDGAKKISFLWRFYRYERNAEGAKNLDVLFVPLMRAKR